MSVCDYGPGASIYPDGECRCLVCSRCGRHTGNATQGHYWLFCTKVGGVVEEFHFCCPDLPCDESSRSFSVAADLEANE